MQRPMEPTKRWHDKRNQDMEEYGFSSMEFFNLDHTLDLLIYPRLCYFRDHCDFSHPRWNDSRTMGQNFKYYV